MILLFLVSCNDRSQQNRNSKNVYNVIPFLSLLIQKKGNFEINENTKIISRGNTKGTVELFINKIKKVTGFNLVFENEGTRNVITFELDENIKEEEGYELRVSANQIFLYDKNIVITEDKTVKV